MRLRLLLPLLLAAGCTKTLSPHWTGVGIPDGGRVFRLYDQGEVTMKYGDAEQPEDLWARVNRGLTGSGFHLVHRKDEIHSSNPHFFEGYFLRDADRRQLHVTCYGDPGDLTLDLADNQEELVPSRDRDEVRRMVSALAARLAVIRDRFPAVAKMPKRACPDARLEPTTLVLFDRERIAELAGGPSDPDRFHGFEGPGEVVRPLRDGDSDQDVDGIFEAAKAIDAAPLLGVYRVDSWREADRKGDVFAPGHFHATLGVFDRDGQALCWVDVSAESSDGIRFDPTEGTGEGALLSDLYRNASSAMTDALASISSKVTF